MVQTWRDRVAAWLVLRGLQLATHRQRAQMMHVISDEWRALVKARFAERDAAARNESVIVCDRCVPGAHGERLDVRTRGQEPCSHVATGEKGAGCRASR